MFKIILNLKHINYKSIGKTYIFISIINLSIIDQNLYFIKCIDVYINNNIDTQLLDEI